MRSRRSTFAGVVLVGVLSLSSCGGRGTDAVSYGDHHLSHGDLRHTVEQIGSNERYLQFLGLNTGEIRIEGEAIGSYSSQFVGAAMFNRMFFDLILDELARSDVAVTADDRAAAEAFFDGPDPATSGATAAMIEAFGDPDYGALVFDGLAGFVKLGGILAPAAQSAEEQQSAIFDQWLPTAMGEADIEVSSRYGTWSETDLQLVPPVGPLTPAGQELPPADTGLSGP